MAHDVDVQVIPESSPTTIDMKPTVFINMDSSYKPKRSMIKKTFMHGNRTAMTNDVPKSSNSFNSAPMQFRGGQSEFPPKNTN